MLKRGKNRPAPAVLRAELEAMHGIGKTFGRGKVTQVRRSRCPFPACAESPAPIFCETHWRLLDGVMRRELLTELRALTSRGQRGASEKMRELFKQAIGEIQMALYKRDAKPSNAFLEHRVRAYEGPATAVVLGPDGNPVRPG